MNQGGKLAASEVAEKLRHQQDVLGHHGIVRRDIINMQAKERRREAMTGGAVTPFQRLLHALERPGMIVKCHREDENDANSPIDRIIITTETCISRLKQHPDLLSYDATYCMNQGNLPFVQATGVNSMFKTFTAFWALISHEKEEDHTWVLATVADILREREICLPKVFLSDFDLATKNAVTAVFGNLTKQQICRWHALKNAIHNIRRLWDGKLDGTAIGETGGGPGSNILNTQADGSEDTSDPIRGDSGEADLASRLLDPDHRRQRHGEGTRNPQLVMPVPGRTAAPPNREGQNSKAQCVYDYSADGILLAWRAVVYALTEDQFSSAWVLLKKEFEKQGGEFHA